jgi:F-type H+-transporting ATPase subunit alpha
MKALDQYIKEIEEELSSQDKPAIKSQEVGSVVEVKDGVVTLEGLDNVSFNEIIEFESGVKGLVIDLTEDTVGAIIVGDYLGIQAGELARGSGVTFSVPASDDALGRVVNPLMESLDGGSKIKTDKLMPVEKIAPGVVYRKSVSVPMQTGIKAIDALVPIGRGQRELIIGDRGTGKTTLAVDTIINQKDQDVICVYCSIGQKRSKVAAMVETLKQHEAMDYTVVMSATASDPVTLQYLAPFAATSVAEYFLEKGKDVLVVYDDLTKHAYAYRQVSLILRRPAGREAYPGDVFYLHSRLLERACRIDEKYGGGSITALPFIETQENDISAYIPTNVISITDGQIFLESDLFNAGIRPAINVGNSVSRVGSSAQTKAMKSVAGRLKLDLAQYRALAAFSQFESDLDEETKKFLARGARATEILKQPKNKPYDLASQVAIMWAIKSGLLDDIDVKQMTDFEKRFIDDLQLRGKDLVKKINNNKVLEESDEKELEKYVKENIT